MSSTQNKNALSIGFRYFSRTFNPIDNFFYHRLSTFRRVTVSDNPQVLFFSVHDGGPRWRMPRVEPGPYARVFFTPENCRPDMSGCEWAFTFDYDDQVQHPNHLRLPLYVFSGAGDNLVKEDSWTTRVLASEPRKFCNFVYSKDAPERIDLFRKLCAYRRVDAPGKSMNNAPPFDGPGYVRMLARIERAISGKSRIASLMARHLRSGDGAKVSFLSNYKFTIAFENSSYPGYATEKIYHPMVAGSLPIYWGNPLIARDFNPRSFINVHDFGSLDQVVERVIEIDQDPVLYRDYLNEPWYNGNQPNEFVNIRTIDARLKKIVESVS